ncbi:thiamine phosphate synthase [Agrobacterium larrymoorei]|uniref:Thiamine-phosphate synthase n=1 Tax=Agrobacterium larrymoorei TaxID=160699 RepID=A0ABU0UGE6_9HYPH|nr:thiamine phosphate synthase [Agrobacterium larrymoorei]MDQ1184015.1 thiamine-phosphate pyrophosphorylase [Agrobacterium larrymoorei]
MTKIDYRLNAIVDASLTDVATLPQLAALAAHNGATIIQYRDKTASTRQMIEQTRAMVAALRDTGVPLVINDRLNVAMATGADGVHLGADDMDADTARRLLGPDAIIGLTVKSMDDARRVAQAPADYACIGGVFETTSKVNPDTPVGLAGLKQFRTYLRHERPDLPVGAIAGITLERVPDVITAGADGVAVISALFRAGDIAATAKAFRSAVDDAMGVRP